MSGPSPSGGPGYISFGKLIHLYEQIQSKVAKKVQSLAGMGSGVNPAAFLLVQFEMSQVTQVGESISNIVATLNSMINASIRNQKVQ